MIDVLHAGPLSGSALERHIARGEVIPQVQNQPDREYPEIRWHQYGVVPTNEVAVTASCGPIAVFALASSGLVFPVMADRIFGTDVMDIQLGQELAEALWRRHGVELATQALIQRTGRR
ncbi:hypothetical protein [Sinimarinibacterium flocculans]|uniref:hypothetical protein n=1 Tax=Sinimarinibacterium flocculans TaxID=985250 RepID=UPI003512AFCF